MIELPIEPHQGIGPAELGVTRAESRTAVGIAPHSIYKTPGGRLVHSYYSGTLQVFFDHTDRVEFIELSNANGTHALYRARDIFSMPADDAVAWVGQDAPYDLNDPELGYSYTFRSLELTLWRPTLPDEAYEGEDDLAAGRVFATVGIGIRGYFANDG